MKIPTALSSLIRRALPVCVLFILGAPAFAQFGGMRMGDMFQPPVTETEIRKIGEMLELDEGTLDLIDSMHQAMETEYDEHRDEMQEIMRQAREEFRDTRDFSVWNDLRPIMEKFGEKRDEMEAAFMDDMKLVLSEEQVAEWPRVERMILRHRSLREGLLSGEAVDLIEMTDDAELSEETAAAIQPVLTQYELDMHRALENRNKVYEEGMTQGMSLFQEQNFEKMEELFQKATEAAERVRDTNKRYVRQIVPMLPEDKQSSYERRFLEESFPRVYRPAYVTTAIEAAQQFDDLTDDQRESINTMMVSYKREAESVNEQWADVIETSESDRTMQSMFMGGRGNDGEREIRGKRRELDRRYEEQLRTVLTEEQVERLPEREERDFRRRGREGFRDGRQRRDRNDDDEA